MMLQLLRRISLLVALLLGLLVAPPLSAGCQTWKMVGDIGQFALPAIALTMTAAHKDHKGVWELGEVVLATELTVVGLKSIVCCTRPNGGKQSFPSGHTGAAFAGAGFIQMRYGWKYGLPAYLGAAVIGLSRIENDSHWAQDVMAGAAIGILWNLLFTHPYKKPPSIQPIVSSDSVGLMWRSEF